MFHDIGARRAGLHPDEAGQAHGGGVRPHQALAEARIVAKLGRLREAVPIIRYHHERWDGRGYPDGLTATEIPLAAAVVGLADAWDAMTTSGRTTVPSTWTRRSPRRRWSRVAVCAEVVDAFFSVVRKRPGGARHPRRGSRGRSPRGRTVVGTALRTTCPGGQVENAAGRRTSPAGRSARESARRPHAGRRRTARPREPRACRRNARRSVPRRSTRPRGAQRPGAALRLRQRRAEEGATRTCVRTGSPGRTDASAIGRGPGRRSENAVDEAPVAVHELAIGVDLARSRSQTRSQ